jgi:prepilin-type N-terminal cleavage/methylation domain-containing protein
VGGISEAPGGPPGGKAGFTVIEVIIAIVILAVGLLGMGGTTVLVVKQTTLADVTTERTTALQSTIERLRALPFDSVDTGADTIGLYTINWTVTKSGQWQDLVIITDGPGLSRAGGFPALNPSVPDTFSYRIIRP